eukprot:GHVU01095035.1.p1 GENE.GHVU01095035.1~~GHVU01095035.1.p1  ORF type:complete len:337 (-),score=17.02 GHVU01095035.1:669-1598(-)
MRTTVPPLSPSAMLQLTLTWLAGGWYLHCATTAGVSVTHFYSCAYKVIGGICELPALRLRFPRTDDELQRAAWEFSQVNDNNALTTCVAAIDGWLCVTNAQPLSRVANPNAFYSGRYRCDGLNVQVAVDALCRVTALAILCPGGTNDAIAYRQWRIKPLIDSLKPGFFVAADAAYPLGLRVQTPFTLPQLTSQARRNFNISLSQCRIRVEMTLGLFSTKWRIFQRPLGLHLDKVCLIVHGCMRLHNYVLNRRLRRDGVPPVRERVDLGGRRIIKKKNPTTAGGSNSASVMGGRFRHALVYHVDLVGRSA